MISITFCQTNRCLLNGLIPSFLPPYRMLRSTDHLLWDPLGNQLAILRAPRGTHYIPLCHNRTIVKCQLKTVSHHIEQGVTKSSTPRSQKTQFLIDVKTFIFHQLKELEFPMILKNSHIFSYHLALPFVIMAAP